MLPSPAVLRREAQKAGLDCVKSIEFGESYSKTLRLWHARFNDKWDQVEAMGFDERFRRMWNFYLTSCASTFHYANCDVTQITLSKPE
jgi:cyclopropane-fatty-acyl-phospholipid synthase